MFMFKKNSSTVVGNNLSTNLGSFTDVPNEILAHVMYFLDLQSLSCFARTNKDINYQVHQLGKTFNVSLVDIPCEGTYSQLHQKYTKFLVASQKRQKELQSIKEVRESINQQRKDLQDNPANRTSCISREEKTFTVVCCVLGTVGGSLFACCFPVNWGLSALIGGISTTPIPLTVSRTTKCMCQKCIECKASSLELREQNLDNNFPPPSKMLK